MNDSDPTDEEAPPDVDYAFLRREGIRHLEAMTGGRWTDFNAHDPGITILEQICYALSDLIYRASFDVVDLLADGRSARSDELPSREQILATDAVAPTDLRLVAMSAAGVKNAWVRPSDATQFLARHRRDEERWELYAQGSRAFSRTREGDPRYQLMTVAGIHRVELELSERSDVNVGNAQREATRAVHAHRAIGTDLQIETLTTAFLAVEATVEVEANVDANQIRDHVLAAVAEYLSPTPRYRSHRESIDEGEPVEDVYDGPLLPSGYLPDYELERLDRRREVHLSDLLRVVMAVPGVTAAPTLRVESDGQTHQWTVPVSPGTVVRLDWPKSRVDVLRARVPIDLHEAAVSPVEPAPDATPGPSMVAASARDRGVGRYHSIQHQLPRTYGIGSTGLPSTAGEQRQAEADQLKAYLLFFDQLLANEFAQLGGLPQLFATGGPPATYFSQPIDDAELGLDDVLSTEGRSPTHLQAMMMASVGLEVDRDRKHRLADHLLARFAEQITVDDGRSDDEASSELLRRKTGVMANYPRLSSARGTGLDYLADGGTPSGLEERLRIELGLVDDEEPLYVLEHILFRPVEQDVAPRTVPEWGRIPVLEAATSDPYSFQLSILLPRFGRFADARFRRQVARLIDELAPAHLVAQVWWLSRSEMKAVGPAVATWIKAMARYGASIDGQSDPGRHLPLRDARDRLIELLGIGSTFPLLDLPVAAPVRVPFGATAKVSIAYSQIGVRYQLVDRGSPVGPSVVGTGGVLEIETPAIEREISYAVEAERISVDPDADRGGRYQLYQSVTIRVGLDTGLLAWIRSGEPLSPGVQNPLPNLPRIVDFGSSVTVAVEHAQEGVIYRLVAVGADDLDAAIVLSEADVVGLGHLETIDIATVPMTEDVEIRVMALQSDERELLDIALQLKVRANPDLELTLAPTVAPYGSAVTLTIADSQAGASYRTYRRPLRDSDFARRVGEQLHSLDHATGQLMPVAADRVVSVSGPGGLQAFVERSLRSHPWATPDGFDPIGAEVSGTGDDVTVELDRVEADALVVVRADIVHDWVGPGGDPRTTPSSIELTQAVALVVEPDPEVSPALRIPMDPDGSLGEIEVTGGTSGVFYRVYLGSNTDEIGLPAYFHQTDDHDDGEEKGIGQTGVEVDLVVARQAIEEPDLNRRHLDQIALDTDVIPNESRIRVVAEKAMTGASVELTAGVVLDALPTIRPADAIIDRDAPAVIEILRSRAQEHYEVLHDGESLAAPQPGTGSMLTVTSPPLQADAVFEVVVTKPDADGLPLTRTASIPVRVRPRSGLVVEPETATIEVGEAVMVTVQDSEPHVDYQLVVADRPIGPSVSGTGGAIELSTGPLAETSRAVVLARRRDLPEITTELRTTITIVVQDGS